MKYEGIPMVKEKCNQGKNVLFFFANILITTESGRERERKGSEGKETKQSN